MNNKNFTFKDMFGKDISDKKYDDLEIKYV